MAPTWEVERRIAPEWFTDELTLIGGEHRFGGPNFDVVWSQTAFIEIDGKPQLQSISQPCWVLRMWNAPEIYGTPEQYFAVNSDDRGKPIAGDYPWEGRYEVVQPFSFAGLSGGKLIHEFFPLDGLILTLVVPVIRQCEELSYMKKLALMQDAHDKKELEQTTRIADRLRDASPAWLGPVSFSRQGCKTSIIEKKMHQIQQNMNNAMRVVQKLGRGYAAYKNQVV